MREQTPVKSKAQPHREQAMETGCERSKCAFLKKKICPHTAWTRTLTMSSAGSRASGPAQSSAESEAECGRGWKGPGGSVLRNAWAKGVTRQSNCVEWHAGRTDSGYSVGCSLSLQASCWWGKVAQRIWLNKVQGGRWTVDLSGAEQGTVAEQGGAQVSALVIRNKEPLGRG